MTKHGRGKERATAKLGHGFLSHLTLRLYLRPRPAWSWVTETHSKLGRGFA
jgi:hypothetical protein